MHAAGPLARASSSVLQRGLPWIRSMNAVNRFAVLAGLEEPGVSSAVGMAGKKGKGKNKRGVASVASSSKQQQPAAAAPSPAPSGPAKLHDPLVWVDLEMTGLNVDTDTIIEVAVLVTDGDLNVVIEGPEIAIHHSDQVLDTMNEWCIEHHGKSGLTQRCKDSTVSLAQAEQQVLEFIKAHVPVSSAQLAGNSIHVDRMFLSKHMPSVTDYLHYRIVDVSTVKELCRRWVPDIWRRAPRKTLAHTAMSDIKESLEELRFYRKHLFKQ